VMLDAVDVDGTGADWPSWYSGPGVSAPDFNPTLHDEESFNGDPTFTMPGSVMPGWTYSLQASYYDWAGISAKSDPVQVTDGDSTIDGPSNFHASPSTATTGAAHLSWSPVSGADGYLIVGGKQGYDSSAMLLNGS